MRSYRSAGTWKPAANFTCQSPRHQGYEQGSVPDWQPSKAPSHGHPWSLDIYRLTPCLLIVLGIPERGKTDENQELHLDGKRRERRVRGSLAAAPC